MTDPYKKAYPPEIGQYSDGQRRDWWARSYTRKETLALLFGAVEMELPDLFRRDYYLSCSELGEIYMALDNSVEVHDE